MMLMHIEIVRGKEGIAVYLNDYRIGGPKPWGGGTVLHSVEVYEKDILEALKQDEPEDKP